jgi:hypothetical protein
VNVAFYKGRSRLFDRLVQWWTRGRYSHCEIVISTDDTGKSLCASASFMDGGVRFKYITLDPAKWDVIQVNADSVLIREWMCKHAGAGYDLLGLFGFVLRIIPHDGQRWFCSEACAAMLGLPEPWRYDPGTLWSALHDT